MSAKRLFNLTCLALTCASLHAASIGALDLIDKTAGLRNIGTGYAGIAAIDPTYAAHWNPANIVYAEKQSVALAYDQQYEANILTGDSVWLVAPKTPLGFSVVQSEVSGIPRTEDQNGDPLHTGSFSDTYRNYSITFGTRFNTLALGSTFKYLTHEIDTYSANGYGLDLGARLELTSQVALGCIYRNILSDISWSTGTVETLESKVGVGLSLLDTLGELPLVINADYDIGITSVEDFWAIGGELWLMPSLLAMRIGTNAHKDITFGLGVHYHDFITDIAVIFKDKETRLDNVFLFSMGLNFAPPKPESFPWPTQD